LLSRALKLVCPRCGVDPMFLGMFRMRPDCRQCGLHYEREPGYFLGSIYVNYGLTAIFTTAVYVLLRFILDLPNAYVVWPLAAFCLIFPILFFRYARAYWLAMDLSFDRAAFDPPDEGEEDEPRVEGEKGVRSLSVQRRNRALCKKTPDPFFTSLCAC
jgi:uncharacterized protein (DUF983 family)